MDSKMGHETDRTRYILPKLSQGNYNTLVKLITNSLKFNPSDPAKFRLHVLDHYYKFGWRSTVDAFGVKKSTLYDWKKVFEKSKKNIVSLVPISTRPKNVRQMSVDLELLELIKSLRLEFGNLSKYKIKPFLDEYSKKRCVSSYGTTKIGVLIKRRNYFFEGKNKRKKYKKPLTPRLKHAPKELIPGYIEMDSITLWVLGKRYYFFTAIDIVTKFAWVVMTIHLSSREAKLAFMEFRNHYKEQVRCVQTDNGHEFLKEFNEYLNVIGINHEFIYPRSPKINGVVERFNRSLQEEFIQRNDEIIYDPQIFNQKLTKYLIWYNTARPHHSLGLISPQAYLEKFR